MEGDPILQAYLQQNRQSRWTLKTLSAAAFQALQNFGHLEASHTSNSKFDVTTSIKISNKAVSTHKKTPGNSYISYTLNSQRWTGCITEILRLNNLAAPLLVVHSLKALGDHDKHKNPYSSLPDLLNASVVYDIHEEHHVIQFGDIIWQLAVIKNLAGTFNIDDPTLSIVGLANIVSDHRELIFFFILSAFLSTSRDLCKTITTKMPWIWINIKTCIVFVMWILGMITHQCTYLPLFGIQVLFLDDPLLWSFDQLQSCLTWGSEYVLCEIEAGKQTTVKRAYEEFLGVQEWLSLHTNPPHHLWCIWCQVEITLKLHWISSENCLKLSWKLLENVLKTFWKLFENFLKTSWSRW